MVGLRTTAESLDAYQQRHAWLGFPIAVARKFDDDRAGSLAAVIAYYAFISIFPLLLVLVVILDTVLHGHPWLQSKALGSALADFPVIGDTLRTNVTGLHRTGLGLLLGLIGSLIGARGVANAAQQALNTIWAVPYKRRPAFPGSQLRSFAALGVIGFGVFLTTGLSAVAGGVSHLSGLVNGGARIGAVAVSLALNILLFWLGFRLTTAAEVPTRDLRVGAVLAAAAWQGLQAVGGYLIGHELRHASTLYGVFGLVLGLLFWLHIQAQLTLFMIEADVVRTRGLWPRSLLAPLTDADRESYTTYAKVEERNDAVNVDVTIDEPDRGNGLEGVSAADDPIRQNQANVCRSDLVQD